MSIEDELHDRLRGVRLVLEIGLDAETVRRATEVVSQIAIRAPNPEETLGTRVPATLAAFLVSLGVERYDGSLWPHLPVKGLDSTKLGQAFLAAIDVLDLEPFDGLGEDLGYRYITRILAHGGIPKYSTRDYLRLVRDELRRHPGASADELVALWRTRRTAFANIDEPVRRFLLYGGGVAVDFLDRTIELLQIPPSETALSMAETIGLPDYILAEHGRTPAAALQRAGPAAGAPRLPRPLVRFDPWGGIGPVVELPAVGARYRNAAWQVASDSRTRILDASLIETRIVPLDPAGSWEVGFDDGSGLGRTYAYECLGTSPLICFDPAAGAYVSDARPVALDHVWVIVPRDAQLTGIDGSGATVEIPVRAELPALSGAWTGFTARHLGLDGMRAIHARLETPGAELVESWTHVVRSADRPAVVGSAIDHVTGDVGEAVYGAMPRLRVPVVAGFGDDRWTVAIKGPGFEMSGSVADLGRQGDSVLIPAPTGPVTGAFDVSVRGPLGSDLRTRFFLVSGLRVETPTKVLLPDDRSPAFVDAEAAPGIAIAGAAGGKTRIAVPHDGTDLSLEVSSAHGAATLHVRLPRLQWGLKRRSALPTLSASRIRIERDDLESGEAESVVVATHRAGIPMFVELWGDDGVHQSSSEGISSPGDG